MMLCEYHPPEWLEGLKNIPSAKLKIIHVGQVCRWKGGAKQFRSITQELFIESLPNWLINGNTPIHKWNLPGIPEEFTLSIKREDMTGSTLSGNKVRKLEFLLAEAVEKKCKHVITCGGVQSNHCRSVAVSARELGIQPHLFMKTLTKDVDDVGCEGNLLLDRLCGAKLYLVPNTSDYPTDINHRMDKLADHIEMTTGEPCYKIPVGGSNAVSLFGCMSLFEELLSQGLHENFDDIVVGCASGGTVAGLAIANYLTGSKVRIHGICIGEEGSPFYHHHCNDLLHTIGLNVRSQDIFDVMDAHRGQGYGLSTQAELDFIVNVSAATGIMLDPVYTAKAAKGLIHELNKHPDTFKGQRILFIHTGGIFGLYDGRIESTVKTAGSVTDRVAVWRDKDELPTFS